MVPDLKTALLFLTLSFLVTCGGGSSGNDDDDDPFPFNNYIRPPTNMDNFSKIVLAADDPFEIPQGEVSMDVDSAGRIFINWIDLRTGVPQLRISRSLDGGATFEDSVLVSPDFFSSADPVVVVGPDDTIYASLLTVDSMSRSLLYLARSRDHGETYQVSAPVTSTVASSNLFYDKQWMAVDSTGIIYMCYTLFDFQSNSSDIYLARSTDDGDSFETPRLIAEGSTQFSQIGIDSQNNVYLTWNDLNNGLFYLRVSDDQGQSFGSSHILNTNETYSRTILNTAIVTPGGSLYITWRVTDYNNDSQVWLAWTHDKGQTVEMQQLTEVVTERTLPWVIADDNGQIHVFFYDKREGGWQILQVSSNDGGESFEDAKIIVSDLFEGTDERDAEMYLWLGDYNQAIIQRGYLYITWTDTTTGNSNIYYAVDDLADNSSPPDLPGFP